MKFKMILFLSILFIISFSAISAESFDNQSVGDIDDSIDLISENHVSDDILDAEEGTFTELQNDLWRVSDGDVVSLEKDYSYDEGFTRSNIGIYKNITIEGNGHTLDGKNAIRIFYVSPDAKQLTLRNINFINAGGNGGGGAILCQNSLIVIQNCTFINNKVNAGTGGAIDINGVSGVSITDSKFIGNSANGVGGAVCVVGNRTIISNCYFEDNQAKDLLGGAILLYGHDSLIKNNTFINNFAGRDGGAVDIEGVKESTPGERNTVINNTFIGNSAAFGGALGMNAINATVSDNIFKNNKAINRLDKDGFWGLGGAMRLMGEKNTETSTGSRNSRIFNNTFINNTAYRQGGAIYIEDTQYLIANNFFKDNNAEIDCGGTINARGAYGTIADNQITSTNSPKSAGAIYFRGNYAKITGNTVENAVSGENGGAINIQGVEDVISNNVFYKNSGADLGGAIFAKGNKAVIDNNKFDQNYVKVSGGALYLESVGGRVTNNEFTSNVGDNRAGALIVKTDSVTITNNKFENNIGENTAGAMYIDGKNCVAQYNNFTSNKVRKNEGGGAIRWIGDNADIRYNTFEKNVAVVGFAIYGGGSNPKVTGNTFIGSKSSDATLRWAGISKFSGNNFTLDNNEPTTITSSAVNTVYNGGKYLVATLKDSNGKPISGITVTIKISNGKTATPTTDSKGQVKYSTNGLTPKTYTATITFNGNDKYGDSSAKVNIVVKKATPKLTASAKTFKKTDKAKKYTVTLKNNQNKVMKNTKVTVTVNKKTYTAKTNAKGQATFKLTKLTKKGKYSAVVKYAGNGNYNAVTKKPKITVK